MNIIKNKVIIWGVDNFNALGLIRQLGKHNLDLLFLIKGQAYCAAKSRYCKEYIETKSLQVGYEYLRSNFNNLSRKPILIVYGDDTMTFVDQHYDELSVLFILPGCQEQEKTTKYIDKNHMTSLAESVGILCPVSCAITKTSSLDKTHYPCLIKPSRERVGHFNEFKYKICYSYQELQRTLKLVHKDSEFILQQYIPKDKDILIYGVRLRTGNTHLAGAFIKDRLADDGSGSHGLITPNIPSVIDVEKISIFLQNINYYGLFSFEYGLFKNKAYFFEVNLRNDGTSHYFYQLGANLPLAYVYDAANLRISNINTHVVRKGIFIDELHDFENVLHRRISYKIWKRDLKNATIFKFYDSQDKLPYRIVRRNVFKQILVDLLQKHFRIYIIFLLDKLGLTK